VKDEAARRPAASAQALLTDVDGVMTDGSVLLLPDGTEGEGLPRPRRPRPGAGAGGRACEPV